MIILLTAALKLAVSDPLPVRVVDVGRFIKLSSADFQALDPSGYDLKLLQNSAADDTAADPLGTTLAKLCYESLSISGSWKNPTISIPEILIRGSLLDFRPVEYNVDYPEIVSAFYSFDGNELQILPFHVQKDRLAVKFLPKVTGSIMNLEKMTATIVGAFQESLLGRPLTAQELLPDRIVEVPAAPPQSLNLSTNLEWNEKKNFQLESKKFTSALGRFVASLSLSVLSVGTYFLHSEAYSRSAAEVGTIYVSGSAAAVFVAASAGFAVESIVRLLRLLRYSR